MDDLLRKGMSFGFSDDMSEARVLVDQNRLLMQQLHERKEEARRHKQAAIQTEQGLIAHLRKQQQDKDRIQARMDSKAAELQATASQIELYRTRVNRPRTLREPISEATLPDMNPDRQKKRAPDEARDLSALTKEMKQVFDVSKQLRDQLHERRATTNPPLDEFRGLVAVSNPSEDEENDGTPVELQEQMIENAFARINRYHRTDWSTSVNYRKVALSVVRQIETLACLKHLNLERQRKLGNKITAIKQSLSSCRSALVRLLSDE
jgi:hypothetical protein